MKIDRNKYLNNKRKDLIAFTAYCRERVKVMRNSDHFLEKLDLTDWDGIFKKKVVYRRKDDLE